jgi:hypothetical protein
VTTYTENLSKLEKNTLSGQPAFIAIYFWKALTATPRQLSLGIIQTNTIFIFFAHIIKINS